MTTDVCVRPLTAADAPAAEAMTWAALSPMWPAPSPPQDEGLRRRRALVRVLHLLATDPGGCWVGELRGEIVGVALALVREDVWGFSLFGVAPAHQGKGIGTRVFAPALAYGEGTRAGIILSSDHPAALRRYALAGLAVRPAISASGALRPASLPRDLRSRAGDPADDADAATCRRASRFVRGASHNTDIPRLLEAGGVLLVLPGRGFAVHREGSPVLLAALDDAAAADLLWSCFAGAPRGGTVTVDFITAGNDWAVTVGLAAGLTLGTDGPVFTRGPIGPLAPYLPSGAYL